MTAGPPAEHTPRRRRRIPWLRALRMRVVDVACQLMNLERTLGVANRLGRMVERLPGQITFEDELNELFAHFRPLSSGETRDLSSDIFAHKYMDRAVAAYSRRRGLAAVRGVIDPASVETLTALRSLKAPTILLTWHYGPLFGFTPLLDAAEVAALCVMRNNKGLPTGLLQFAFTGGGADERAAALWTAVQHLRSNGLVLIAADGQAGERTGIVEVYGREVAQARGPFLLARLTGATIIPAVVHWTDERRLGITLGEPIPNARPAGMSDVAYETLLATSAGKWAEQQVLARPSNLRTATVKLLLRFPARDQRA